MSENAWSSTRLGTAQGSDRALHGPSADLRFLAVANQHVLDVKFQLQGIYLGITNKKFLLGIYLN